MINNVNNFLSMGEFNKTGGMKMVNWEVQHGRLNTTDDARFPVYVSARFTCSAGVAERYRINGATMQGGDALDQAGYAANIIVQYSPN
ncbi:MAG: hypothetical protein WA277_00870 [Nitrospirota bacterium]